MSEYSHKPTAADYAQSLGWTWSNQRHEWEGLCPCHEPSGTHTVNAGLKDEQGRVLWKCFAGCTFAQLLEVVGHSDFAPQASRLSTNREIARYAYTDEHDTVLYYNIRYEPKTFKMARPGPEDTLIWRTKDLPRRVVYRLSTVLENQHVLFFVEGEKDVETLEGLGLRATCIAGGADGWSKYAKDYRAQLTGQDLVIIPDNDLAGHRLAETVCHDLQGLTSRIRLLELPGVPTGGDVSDWIAQGGTVEQLWLLVEAISSTGDTTVVEISATDLLRMEFKPIRWYATGLLHEGMILFGGKSKRGKSWIMLNLALSISSGGMAFGYYEIPQPAKVLYCALEDGPRRTQRRLRMLDPQQTTDFSGLKIAFRMPPLEDGGIEYITKHIKEGYEVIVVDVLAHVEGSGKHGLKDYHEVYRTFAPLQSLRSQYPFAIVMVTHLRKSESEEVFDNLHGSVAYQGAQDALWVMERKSGDDVANLHIRDKDAEDKVVELRFDGSGLWSFVGEGDEHVTSRMEDTILQYLREEKKPQAIKDIMLGCGIAHTSYSAFRVRLHRMVKNGLLLRSDRGMYVALEDVDHDADPY